MQANATGEASAERSADISLGINRLPDFLRELRPLMADLDDLANQGTPVLTDLGKAAPNMDRLIRGLGTFSEAANESFPSLGDALERGRPALIQARPLIRQLRSLGREAEPATREPRQADREPEGHRGRRAHQRLPLLPRRSTPTASTRSATTCARGWSPTAARTTSPRPAGGCNANFYDPFSSPASASTAARNAGFDKAQRPPRGSVPPQGTLLQGLLGSQEDPAQARQREQGIRRLRDSAGGRSKALGGDDAVLDYLLGGDR